MLVGPDATRWALSTPGGGPGLGGSPALAGSRAQTAGTEERTLADWDLDETAWRAPEAGHGKVRLSILPSPYLIPRRGPYLNPYLHCHGKVRLSMLASPCLIPQLGPYLSPYLNC